MSVNSTALSNVLRKYDISPQMAQRLKSLEYYKIVLILDDSSSMNTVDSYDGKSTRWDELSKTASIMIEIASVFNPDGCDVYFLNMAPVKKVRNVNQIEDYFDDKPQGATPLSQTLKNVIKDNPVSSLDIKSLLIIIATDGEPTDLNGFPNIPEFKQTLKNRPSYVFTNIAACTNDQNAIGYLNGLDKELPRLDVIDDYQTEAEQIAKIKGSKYKFSFGDYVTKAMLGSVNPDLDRQDEYNEPAVVAAKPATNPVKQTVIPVQTKPSPVQPSVVVPQRTVKRSGLSKLYITGPKLYLRDLLCCSSF